MKFALRVNHLTRQLSIYSNNKKNQKLQQRTRWIISQEKHVILTIPHHIELVLITLWREMNGHTISHNVLYFAIKFNQTKKMSWTENMLCIGSYFDDVNSSMRHTVVCATKLENLNLSNEPFNQNWLDNIRQRSFFFINFFITLWISFKIVCWHY